MFQTDFTWLFESFMIISVPLTICGYPIFSCKIGTFSGICFFTKIVVDLDMNRNCLVGLSLSVAGLGDGTYKLVHTPHNALVIVIVIVIRAPVVQNPICGKLDPAKMWATICHFPRWGKLGPYLQPFVMVISSYSSSPRSQPGRQAKPLGHLRGQTRGSTPQTRWCSPPTATSSIFNAGKLLLIISDS